MLGAESVLRARSGLASVEIDGDMILYEDDRRRFHRLSPSAAAIWECLDGNSELAAIADDLAAVYGVEPGTVLQDVIRTVEQLAQEGLVS